MVVTDLPFARSPLRLQRYNTLYLDPKSSLSKYISTSPATSDSGQVKGETTRPVSEGRVFIDGGALNYTNFLKEVERNCGPDGFVDSSRYSHRYRFAHNKPPLEKKKPQSFAVEIANVGETAKKSHDKQMKLIESQLWDHKQKERELKRLEGDIKKNQQHVREMLRSYETAVQRKKFVEEKSLKENLDEAIDLQNNFHHRQTNLTRKRINKDSNVLHASKDQERKCLNSLNQLTLRFKQMEAQVDRKEHELSRMVSDFEKRVEENEATQNYLRKNLSELALSINMESKKLQERKAGALSYWKKEAQDRIDEDLDEEKNLTEKLSKGDFYVRTSLANRRKLSSDLSITRAHLAIKARDENRARISVNNTLQVNSAGQVSLSNKAEDLGQELKVKQSEEKLQEAIHRKEARIADSIAERMQRGLTREKDLSNRFASRFVDLKKTEHEDHLKHIQRQVEKDVDAERQLYEQATRAEFERRKHEKILSKMRENLEAMQRENKRRMTEDSLIMQKAEEELQQNIEKRQSLVAKAYAEREFSNQSLQRHRAITRENKKVLQNRQKEHSRLLKIRSQTNATVI